MTGAEEACRQPPPHPLKCVSKDGGDATPARLMPSCLALPHSSTPTFSSSSLTVACPVPSHLGPSATQVASVQPGRHPCVARQLC